MLCICIAVLFVFAYRFLLLPFSFRSCFLQFSFERTLSCRHYRRTERSGTAMLFTFFINTEWTAVHSYHVLVPAGCQHDISQQFPKSEKCTENRETVCTQCSTPNEKQIANGTASMVWRYETARNRQKLRSRSFGAYLPLMDFYCAWVIIY